MNYFVGTFLQFLHKLIVDIAQNLFNFSICHGECLSNRSQINQGKLWHFSRL